MYPDYATNPGEIFYVTNTALIKSFAVTANTSPAVFGDHYKLNYSLSYIPSENFPGSMLFSMQINHTLSNHTSPRYFGLNAACV